MLNVIVRALVFVVAIFVTDWLLPGVAIKTLEAGLWVAFFLVIINTFIRPIISFFTLPVTLLTLGFFPLVLNTIFILIIAYVVDGFSIFAATPIFVFLRALTFGLLLTIVQFILNQVAKYIT